MDIRRALESYCKGEFRNFFGYDYDGGKPPNSIKAFQVPPGWFHSPNSMTGSGRVEWVKSLPVTFFEYVFPVLSRYRKQHLTTHSVTLAAYPRMSNVSCACMLTARNICISFASTILPAGVLKRLKNKLGNFVSTYPSSARGTWTVEPLQVEPEPEPGAPKTANSSGFNGYLCFFTEEATTNSDYDVALTYVLIMGVRSFVSVCASAWILTANRFSTRPRRFSRPSILIFLID